MLALSQVEADVAGFVLVDVTPTPDVSRTRAYLAPRGALGASPLVDDILSRSDQLSRNLRAMTLPILLVCGGARSPLDEDARARFTTLAPHAAIRTIEQAGHLVARDAPHELAAMIAGFAAKRAGSVRRKLS